MANRDQPIVPPPGKPFRLAEFDPENTSGTSKEAALALIPSLRLGINELQDLLYADRRYALLIVLQGIDTAGKDGTIKSVFQEVGPLGSSVANFGVPSAEEAAHDFLWRYHARAPEKGKVVIFNRSYYESVLVERVDSLVSKDVWKARYDTINEFERYLVAQQTVIAKFFLHISKGEQRERLQERVDNPKKRWKFREGDLQERAHWDAYQEAFEDMVGRCNTAAAPWHVVPADHKWYRDVVIAKAIIALLESLDLHYPKPVAGVEGTVVE
ncbi:MAG: polyphosphate kinase 2 family protein [Chloroflexi bacterium]|nr:polyphosphate kinase 2 family protein [Chloroflexota bacterium]